MSYRPKGWKNPNRDYNASLAGAYEAGADAMLTCLWQMALESPTGTFTIDSRVVNIFEVDDEYTEDVKE